MSFEIVHEPSPSPRPVRSVVRLGVVTVATGVGAGLGGMLLALLLHAIQHVAYGYSLDKLVDTQSFLQGVSEASSLRRVIVMVVCGVIAGFGWWALKRFGRPLVSISKTLASPDAPMPARTTLVHALLQIVTVALGSPLGREVAPREVGAVIAGWLAKVAGLTPGELRLLVACGAGAGLAAVYNVPLGGAVFVLEVLLGTLNVTVVAMALAASVIAALTARIGLGNETQYVVPALADSTSLIVWAVIIGPILGVAAYGFRWITKKASAAAPRGGWQLPVFSMLNFTLIGLLAIGFPQLLGNGKSAAQLGFDSHLTIGLAAALLVLKVVITTSSLRVGAYGGVLTPSLAIGALAGIVLGGLCSLFGVGLPSGAFALVGGAAFLASSMNMPITAVVLIAEFTHIGYGMLVPIVLAVAGSITANRLCKTLAGKSQPAARAQRAPL
ncbi:chloride channel protein [Paraburkholderia humisilvae]|uniref:Voltage-gated ClC-type chloride channel ClcB n=1 Tax=Paraburkholderia humisilvae TaxID=627669 RepID=A0A6J5F5W0_9BURK|nr:chloride channel protein [Paraburkholderia humisilvae]CAB3773151.1 Voltage-gated ClC-type chloride channel ClcB [Paraburkholderia humisilvae]